MRPVAMKRNKPWFSYWTRRGTWLWLLVLLVGALAPGASLAHAQGTVSVPATATGGFGDPNGCYTGLVPAFSFSGPQTVILTTSGTISLDSPPFPATPKGGSVGSGVFPSYLFPLEEAFNDGGGSPAIESSGPSVNAGALIGAFVPAAVVSTTGFEAVDQDIPGGGIPSTSLFLIGSGVFEFAAPGAGTLFLGVNASYACYNSGSFSVTLTLPVEIDIDPGGSKRISLSAAGLVPVAVLSSPTFDATTVDPQSLTLMAPRVNLAGTSGPTDCRQEDVNGDGLADLVCDIHIAQPVIEPGSSVAVLEGQTSDGINIRGEDLVEIVADQ